MAGGLVPFCFLMDYLLYPDAIAELVRIRVALLLVAAGGYWLNTTGLGRRYPDGLAFATSCGFALLASALPVFLLGYATPYYVCFILVACAVGLVLPWRRPYALALALSLPLAYLSAALLHGSIDDWSALVLKLSSIGATVSIVGISMGGKEALRRREFRARVALEGAERSKQEIAAALAERDAEREALNREMEDLLYVVSHDLRAPLISLQGFARELQLGCEQLRGATARSPETRAAFADIDESLRFTLASVERMDVLITSLLNVSRIATRTNPTEHVDLNALLQRVRESFDYQLTQRSIAFEADPLPAVIGDPIRLTQLFGNLIDNAIKCMNNGRQRRIHVGAAGENGDRRFFVRDTGPGIPHDQQEQVFRLFRRLANNECAGEGIGLTLVRKIVEKHGGHIWVESAPGTGATFWFTLRRASASNDPGGVQ